MVVTPRGLKHSPLVSFAAPLKFLFRHKKLFKVQFHFPVTILLISAENVYFLNFPAALFMPGGVVTGGGCIFKMKCLRPHFLDEINDFRKALPVIVKKQVLPVIVKKQSPYSLA